jgi:hypothetical protein
VPPDTPPQGRPNASTVRHPRDMLAALIGHAQM